MKRHPLFLAVFALTALFSFASCSQDAASGPEPPRPSMSGGSGHSLAIKTDGSLWAWGFSNEHGQLGYDTQTFRMVPRAGGTDSDDPIGDGARAYRLGYGTPASSREIHKSVTYRLEDGSLVSRLDDSLSSKVIRLDDGSLSLRLDDSLSSKVIRLDDGALATVIHDSGSATSSKVIGKSVSYSLDDGTLAYYRLIPERMSTDSDGQLIEGLQEWSIEPVRVGADSDWASVAVALTGEHSLAIKTDGGLWAWGDNEHGQLGVGTTTEQSAPLRVGTDNDWKLATTASLSGSFAIKTDGSLWAWGLRRDYQRDEVTRKFTATETNILEPMRVGTDSDWKFFASGNAPFAIKANGSLWELDLGREPKRVGTDNDWASVSIQEYGHSHSLAIRTDGSLWAWGNNEEGQLGTGTTTTEKTPVRVGAGGDWTSIATAFRQSFAIKADGSLWAWGSSHGNKPARVGARSNWKYVASSEFCVLATKTNGSLWELRDDEPTRVGTDSDWAANTTLADETITLIYVIILIVAVLLLCIFVGVFRSRIKAFLGGIISCLKAFLSRLHSTIRASHGESGETAKGTESATAVLTESQRQLLGVVSSAILFVGVFAPMVSAPVVGSMNYFQNGKGHGTIILLMAAASLFLTLRKKYGYLWVTGLGSVAVLLFDFIRLQIRISGMQANVKNGQMDGLAAGLADGMLQAVQVQWGWPMLLIAAVLLIWCAAMKTKQKTGEP